MVYVLIAIALIIVLLLYRNSRFKFEPRLWLIYGKKRSGKSTYLCKVAKYAMKQGRRVFSTVPIKGAILIPDDSYYRIFYPPGSVILVDEVGLVHNSREFKQFPREAREWYKLQGHQKIMVVACSQTADCDITLRHLADYVVILRRIGPFGMLRYYNRRIVLARNRGNDGQVSGGSEIVDDVFPMFPLFGISLCFNRRYWDMHDSWSLPDRRVWSDKDNEEKEVKN